MKNRLFSAINVFGLAIGMMSCILILLYVQDEVSYDDWVPESEQIVRLHSAFYQPGRPPFLTVRSAGRMMEAIKNYATTEVEAGVRLLEDPNMTIIKGETAFSQRAFYADPSFFEVFDLPFLHGDAATAFLNPLDMVISEDMAIKYFGRTDVVGETITACCFPQERMDIKVSGVIKNVPESSHFSVDIIVLMDPSMFDFAPNLLNTWTSVNVYTYFKLNDGITAADLKERLYYWLDNESPFVQMFKDNAGALEGITKVTDGMKPNIMPLEDLHLYARGDAGNMPDLSAMGDINMIYTFTAVAGLVLLIAAINFMNLSTARATKRSREVALRKVMGASRGQVAIQFLGEALAVAGLGLIFALVGVELALPFYNDALGRSLELDLLGNVPLMASLIGIAVAVGLISGSYPAVFLSRFLPAKILRANTSSSADGGGTSFRGTLVILQFAVSIGLAVCTAVVYGQTMYAQNLDVGYKYDGKLVLGGIGAVGTTEGMETLRTQLANLPGVKSVVLSSDVPSQDFENNTVFKQQGADADPADGNGVLLNYYSIGFGYMEAYEITPLAGRSFSREFGTDEIVPIPDGEERVGVAGLMINETALRDLGYATAEDAIGKTLQADIFRAGTYDMTIVGVIPDIYFRSIKHGVRASAYFVHPGRFRSATITYSDANLTPLQAGIEKVWQENAPLTPISVQFLSDMMAAQYASEETQAKLFAAFSGLALIVACLGLYGLASFSAEQRTKEIGIRKVLGATVVDVVRLLVWQFSRPVLIANLIAWPVAWYLMSGWLEGFQYRLESSFLLTAGITVSVIALLIAWITVASRALRVAQTNPIHALRYE
ncbi:MAG: ABC transporter permease [Kordiimonadaceae bacterium]|nr:ABC transporter permease [Kordiimonadaceae bacterium]